LSEKEREKPEEGEEGEARCSMMIANFSRA